MNLFLFYFYENSSIRCYLRRGIIQRKNVYRDMFMQLISYFDVDYQFEIKMFQIKSILFFDSLKKIKYFFQGEIVVFEIKKKANFD